MSQWNQAYLVAVAAAFGIASAPSAADDMFLRFNSEIVGESTDAKHAGAIDVDSYGLGVKAISDWTKGGGASVGKPAPGEFRFTAAMNSSVPTILRYIATGRAADGATLTVRTAAKGGGNRNGRDGFEYLKLTFTGLYFTSLEHMLVDGGRATSEVSAVYRSLRTEYTPLNPNGTAGSVVCTLWDIPAGTVNSC